jgi:4-amino-4-deoxy-L-arabinose transferase-like glycosyltransferase
MHMPKGLLSRSRLVLAAVVVVALFVRAGFLIADPHPFDDSGLAADSAEVARQIDLHGRWFQSNLVAVTQLGTLQDEEQRLLDPAAVDFRAADAHPQWQPEALQPPGEPVVLAGLWKLIGTEEWLPYQIVMIALSALLTVVVFDLGLRLFGRRRTAYLGALLYAVFPPIAWLSTIPHLDAWAVDFTIIIAALLVRARSAEKATRWLVGAGIAIGLGSYFRPSVLLIAPLVALATLTRPRWRESLRLALVPSLVAIVLLVPWTIRNVDVFSRFIPVRIGGGQALWEGMGEVHNTFGAVLDDAATYSQIHAVRPDLVYGSPAYDSFLLSWGMRAIRQHSVFYAKLVVRRLAESTALLQNIDWAGAPNLFARALEPLLFLISLLTVVLTRRRFGRAHLIAGAVIVATILPYLFLHLEARYILPASFAYLLWAALALDLLVDHWRPGTKARDLSARDRRASARSSAAASGSLINVRARLAARFLRIARGPATNV